MGRTLGTRIGCFGPNAAGLDLLAFAKEGLGSQAKEIFYDMDSTWGNASAGH